MNQKNLMMLLMLCAIVLFVSDFYVNMENCSCGKNNCENLIPKRNASRGILVIATMLFTMSLTSFLMGTSESSTLVGNSMVTVVSLMLGIVIIVLNSIIVNVSNKNENCSKSRLGGVIGLITGILITLTSGASLALAKKNLLSSVLNK
jgi:hypothetical protein